MPSINGTDNQLVLQHYLRYVIQEESGPLRDRLQRGLAERALKVGNPQHTMTLEAVKASIERQTTLPDYPSELITKALSQLVERGDALRSPPDGASGQAQYRLTHERWTALDEMMSEVAIRQDAFTTPVLEAVEDAHGPLGRDEKRLVVAGFEQVVARILGSYGEHAARSLIEAQEWGDTADYPTFRRELEEAAAALPHELQATAVGAYEAALTEPTAEERLYLFSLGQAYYVTQLLHLDPDLQALQRERFEDTFLFLDTNLLLAAVLESDPDHHAVVALLRICSGLGFALKYSEETSQEVERLLDWAQDEWTHAPPFDLGTAAAFAPLVGNAFVKDFLLTHDSTQWSWSQYRVRMLAWQTTLQGMAGVGVDISCRASNRDRAQILERALLGVGRIQNGRTIYSRNPRAAKHDAHMIAALEALVAGDGAVEHPFGNRFWFLTLDRKLTEVARKRALPEVGGICMLAEEWAQYVSPFLGPDISSQDRADIFAQLLASRFFVSLGENLSLQELQPYTAPNVDELMTGLSHGEACRLIAKVHAEGTIVRPDHPEDNEVLIARLSEFVELELNQKRARGELVPASEVRGERARAHELHAQQKAEANEEIERLRRAVEQGRRYEMTSLGYWIDRSVTRIRASVLGLTRYIRHHRIRLALGAAALGFGIVLLKENWIGAASNIVGLVSFAGAFILWASPVRRRR